jgi:hypothetical protein
MSAKPQADLQEVKSKFENFRAARVGKEKPRLPENLWAEAVGLLEHYPFKLVWQELRLKPEYLKQRAGLAKESKAEGRKRAAKFLALTTGELRAINNGANKNVTTLSAGSECRLVIERSDGSRLLLNLPCDWSRIEALCADFVRG